MSKNRIALYCTDGVMATAIARKTKNKWKIFGISEIQGFGSADYNKDLFDVSFDDIRVYNSISGVGYIAVKTDFFWGLICYR